VTLTVSQIGWKKLSPLITDKEISYGQDREKEKSQSHKTQKAVHLYLFFMWEGHENPLPLVLTRQGRTDLYMRILRRDERRPPARMFADGDEDEIFLQELRTGHTVSSSGVPADAHSITN